MMKKIVSAIVGIIVSLVIFWLIYTVKSVSWDFRNNLWAPTYLIWHGESAYNINILFADSNAIWFPQVIGLFFPLGLLTQYQATITWQILNIVLLLALIWFMFCQASQEKPKSQHLGILVLSVFLFPPTLRHLILGQVDVLLIMSILAGTYAIEKHRLTLGGFLFAIALVKPQHCIVVLPNIVAYFLLNKREWRNVLKLFLTTCFFVVTLTTPLWLSNSNWISDFLSNLQRNPNWAQPNIFSVLHNKFGILGLVFWFILYILILVLSNQIWLKYNPAKAVLWSLALTTIISPYIWSWDFVLLLPLFIDTAIRLSNAFSRIMLSIFYIACFVLSVLSLQSFGASDQVLWWIPFMLIVGIVASITINKKMAFRCI